MPTEFTIFNIQPGAVPKERHYALDWGVDQATIQFVLDDMEEMADDSGEVRLMMVVDSFRVATPGGMREKMRQFSKIRRQRGRYALVTDSWLVPFVYPLIRLLSPLKVRRFHRADVKAARDWVRAS